MWTKSHFANKEAEKARVQKKLIQRLRCDGISRRKTELFSLDYSYADRNKSGKWWRIETCAPLPTIIPIFFLPKQDLFLFLRSAPENIHNELTLEAV